MKTTMYSALRALRRTACVATCVVSSALAAPLADGPPQDLRDPPAVRPGPAITTAQASPRAIRRNPHRETESAEALPEVELTPQLMFRVLASEIAVQRGEIGSAALTYLALARETRDPRLARRATELGIADRSPSALAAARVWYQVAPASALAAQTLEGLLFLEGHFGEAEPLVEKRLAAARTAGTLEPVYVQLRRTLPTVRDRTAALRLIERVSRPDRDLADARLTVAAVAHAAGDHPRAQTEITEAIRLRPDDSAVLMATLAYGAPGEDGAQAARARVASFLTRHPDHAELHFVYAQMLAAAAQDGPARAAFDRALALEPDNPRMLLRFAQFAHRGRQPELAEQSLKRYLALAPQPNRDPDAARLLLGAIAEETNRAEEALRWYAQVSGEQLLTALARRAVLMGKMGRLPEARELLRSAPAATSSERVRLIATEAELLRGLRRHDEAFEVLDKALAQYPSDHDLLYAHAMGAERANRLDIMEQSLRKLIALDPKHAHAYNALGYTLADRNLRLPEAQELIEKALALQPESAHILDSLGWVLFRRGQNEQALEQLFKAYRLKPEADVAAHLGEVLWASGRADEARTIWREGLKGDPENETLRETLARLGATP